ncbi:MAG: hypothetical protein IKF41_01960 [Alphaproteobacteria bacterium]|nr:hypothetical protein [Alphaproteobacteria bacterium]
MNKKFFVLMCLFLLPYNALARDVLPLDDALRATYIACIGIDEELSDLKKMAGINTAITAVGTGLGAGAVATGLTKAKTDELLAQKYQEMKDLSYAAAVWVEPADPENFLQGVKASLEDTKSADYKSFPAVSDTRQAEIDRLESKSKRLGNWRTGLLAGNTATNIAGAIIAGTNKADKSLQEQIDDCRSSVKSLRDSIIVAKMEGQDVAEAKQIQDACSGFDYVDISKINKRATGAMVSSSIGAGTGFAGTITSALANSNKVRNNNTDQGQQKEKNLNTASNVLAVGSTAASATATVFNATQIKAIKDVASVAEQCSGVLK